MCVLWPFDAVDLPPLFRLTDSDDFEEEDDEPSTGAREQPLTPEQRVPLLAVQYSSSHFGPDQERRCRQRMDGNSVVQNMLGMKKIVS